MKIGAQDEVFLICLTVAKRNLWLAWVASLSGADFFLAENKALLWSDNDADIKNHLKENGLSVENEISYFDIDDLLRGLRRGSIADPDLAINVWNMFTDLYNTFHDEKVAKFCEDIDLNDLYGRLFSLCGAAEIIGLEASRITSKDMDLLYEIVGVGVAMVAAHTDNGNRSMEMPSH